MTEGNRKHPRQNNRRVGVAYEEEACAYLEQKGFQILARNFRCRFGEIDLIARDGETIVFCEVKYRKNDRMGHPYEAVTPAKQRTICKCARVYLMQTRRQDVSCRFDVISIEGETWRHFPNAFSYVGG